MFKKACFVLVFLLFLSTVYGIRLVEPISKTLENGDFVGQIASGQELNLIVSKELGKFDSLEVKESLPSNFEIKQDDYLEYFLVHIKSDEKTLKTTYDLELTISGDGEESAKVYFLVDDSLLDLSFLNYSAEVPVDGKAKYEVLLINNSDADAEFEITPRVPWFWTNKKSIKVEVDKRSTKIAMIEIFPRMQGEHFFDVEAKTSDFSKKFTLFVDAKPTLNSKFSSAVNGFPVYSVSLLPSYLINSFFTLIFS
jgi:hypothetical protein